MMMIDCDQLLISLILLLKCLGARASSVYHITNSTNASCPEEPCLTLPQFAANAEIYLESGTSLIFLPGHHYLNLYINISAVSNFSMLSSSTFLCCPTVILCERHAGINFSSIDSVYMGYMRFIRCRGHQAISTKTFVLDNMIFTYHSESAFQFVSSGVKITRTSFISNSGGSIHNVLFGLELTPEDQLLIAIFGISNWYPETGAAIAVTQSNVVISDCVFEGNQAQIGSAIFVEKFSNITIINTAFEQNIATCHISRCISGAIYSGNSTIAVFNGTFYGNKLVDNNEPPLLHHNGGVFGLFESTFSATCCIFARNRVLIAHFMPHRNNLWPAGIIIYAQNTILNISNSTFRSNSNDSSGEDLFASNIVCIASKMKFEYNNAVDDIGVVASQSSIIAIYESQFNDGNGGGVFFINYTNITIKNSLFENNTGMIMTIYGNSNIDIFKCNFTKNYAGTIMYSWGDKMSITIIDSLYVENFAEYGGVIEIRPAVLRNVGIVIIKNTKFIRNERKNDGLIVCSECASMMLISDCDFIGNVVFTGGALHVINTNVTINGGIMERNNMDVSLIHAVQDASISINGTVLSYNTGSAVFCYFLQSIGYLSHLTSVDNQQSLVFALFSIITFKEIAIYSSPQQVLRFTTPEQGGAILVVQSKIVFEGTCFLNRNYARKGGAIHAIESKIHIHDETTIANNVATKYGGGVYLHNSQLNCYSRCVLEFINNIAGDKGGGIYAIGSYISAENTGIVTFQENSAMHAGGAVSLEQNSKVHIIVKSDICSPPYTLTFTNNSADYGGAIFVADETNSGTCASKSYNILSTTTECFMQLLSARDYFKDHTNYHTIVTFFADNRAYVSGSNVFGGLLDRCTLSRYFEKLYHQPYIVDGVTYFNNTSISKMNQIDSISSEPVRVCFCNEEEQPDCSYHPQPVRVSKGKLFSVSLVAVDQVSKTVPNVTIRSYLLHGGLGENQLHQNTGDSCTDLKFEVFSPYESEQLILYADGPCKDAPLSRSIIEINFTSCDCPIGFQPNTALETRCECECNSHLQLYVFDCDPKAETITREGDFWVDFVSASKDYLIHPHCPFDYCKPSNERIAINLNVNSGANAQCANNRSGILCGQCSVGTSLSISNSHCIKCPTYWPLLTVILLITSVLAGIFLVGLVLSLNLTVAVGTLNGVIFYANIVAANTNSVFPPNVIIAWLNLEPGINRCFFYGMTTYWKTWLQLAFPAYVIFLVALVILISERCRRFSRLIGKKDPVATLATLVLFSYAKLLHTIIASLSGTVLKYPGANGTYDDVVVWLPDASIKYLSGTHIPLFIIAILILLAGIAYTMMLFFWQCLLRFKLFNHTPKLSLFIQTHHTPYTPKYRYWTGLLLIARIILYIIFAANVKGDPKINLIAIGVVVVSILIVRDFVKGSGQLYQKWPIEMLEIACHFNLVILCIVTFFTLRDEAVKNIFAQISMSITIVMLLGVLLYHLFTEIVFKTKLWQRLTKDRGQNTNSEIDTATLEGSNIPKPTHSVVEGPKQLSNVLRGRKGGRVAKNINGPCELKEILLDDKNANYIGE